MDDLTFEVLSWLSAGNRLFRPRESTAAGEEAFRGVVSLLQQMRGKELVTYLDGHVTRTEAGIYLMVGPVYLAPKGIAALERDIRSGPRPPWGGGALPWRV